jgi:hypothetical protein
MLFADGKMGVLDLIAALKNLETNAELSYGNAAPGQLHLGIGSCC